MRAPFDKSTMLITGASSGIGREFARQLAPRARVMAIAARRVDRLEELAVELKKTNGALEVLVRPMDLTNADQACSLVEELESDAGGLDILINNAGYGDVSLYEATDWPKIEQMIAINCTALSYLTRLAVTGMVARRRGGILNVSSGWGLTWSPGFAPYAGTKHFVTGFTESLRIELAGVGIAVSQLCPGPVKTEFLDVAGNPFGQDVPGFVELSAERCARITLKGFARGKAIIIPGFWAKLMIGMGRITPRPILRLVYRLLARSMRKAQLGEGRPEADEQQAG